MKLTPEEIAEGWHRDEMSGVIISNSERREKPEDRIATLERELKQTKAWLAEVERDRDEARVNYANQVTDKAEAAPIDHAIFEGLRADLSSANLFIENLRHDLAHKELAYATDTGQLAALLKAAQKERDEAMTAAFHFHNDETVHLLIKQRDSAQHLAAEWQAVAEALREAGLMTRKLIEEAWARGEEIEYRALLREFDSPHWTVIISNEVGTLTKFDWNRWEYRKKTPLAPADALREHDLKLAREVFITAWARRTGSTQAEAAWRASSIYARLTKSTP